ncbi:MAG: septal ring lytic transglycosylase RlpA family protein [Alphaproteobacteria bacterium]|nr:septal ring lytic transglycosylase RlpA family protein [Alphaproteobacteria bacterium]
MRTYFRIIGLFAVIALSACGGGRGPAPSAKQRTSTGDSGYYKVGKPYQIKGNWYYPKEDYSYDETGIASWYGADFHNQATANGEIYNKNELTAAHKTLPMPSLARVTNLENGRSIVVRVNDRGPFSGARVIDVSQRASQLLGFERQGTAKVRVQVLADESKAIADAMRTYGGSASSAQVSVASSTVSDSSVEVASLGHPEYNTAFTTPVQPQALPPIQAVHPVAEYVQVPVSGANLIYVQAGAFTNKDNASRLQKNLQKVGQTRIAEAQVKGVQYYRVRVGPIATVADADKLLKRVLGSGADSARIIVD